MQLISILQIVSETHSELINTDVTNLNQCQYSKTDQYVRKVTL
jgi:hypothetical protein